MAINIDEIKKLRAYLDAIIEASAVIAEEQPKDPEPVDVAAWKTSVRNRILAGSGDKAALFGTLSTEPTVAEKELTDLDVYPSLAADICTARDDIRAAALALTAVVAEPIEEIKP